VVRPRNRVWLSAIIGGGSFGEASDNSGVLWVWLVRNLERLVEELEYHNVLTGRIAVWIGYKDGRAGEGSSTLAVPDNQFERIRYLRRAGESMFLRRIALCSSHEPATKN
jgi:hypothetical protein